MIDFFNKKIIIVVKKINLLAFLMICFFSLSAQKADMSKARPTHKYIIDINGDGKSDFCVLSRKEKAIFIKDLPAYQIRSLYRNLFPCFGDFDGDGRTEIAFFSQGFIYIVGMFITSLGKTGDLPVPADFDGDGKTDFVLWRPEEGNWFFLSGQVMTWGQAQDIPIPMDYDGDGRADFAVWRPNNGSWFINFSSGAEASFVWGNRGDIPVPADYNGDGKAEAAVWRPTSGSWFIRLSDKETTSLTWGRKGDIPLAGDFDGDGKFEPAVWRPEENTWYIYGKEPVVFGQTGDIPLSWNTWILWFKGLIEIKADTN